MTTATAYTFALCDNPLHTGDWITVEAMTPDEAAAQIPVHDRHRARLVTEVPTAFETLDRDRTYEAGDLLRYNLGIVTVWGRFKQVVLQPGDLVMVTGEARFSHFSRATGRNAYLIQAETENGDLIDIVECQVRTDKAAGDFPCCWTLVG